MTAVAHDYYVGTNEARARGLDAPPGGARFDIAVLEARPLPISEGLVVAAEANDGRWVVRCPFCKGAEAVTAAYPVFWCDTCEMAEAHGQAARVAFPAELDAIDAELARRPRAHRCYVPGEIEAAYEKRGLKVDVTPAEWLRAESIVHGWVSSTVAERLVAKSIVWGPAAVAQELKVLKRHGAEELERRYHEGG